MRQIVSQTDDTVINVDKLTYAGNLESLADTRNHPRHTFCRADICDGNAIGALLAEHQPTAIIHLAAESHVDRSIDGPGEFVRTNMVGTYTMLDEARRYWATLPMARRDSFRFIHVSTDEVFGSLSDEGRFTESTPYAPTSPYSASKAGSDHLVRAWEHTYGLPAIITNCSNNYGPYQFPEKLIPLTICKALRGEVLPIFGRGENVRDWLYVDDHARALRLVCDKGVPGETYNIGGQNERQNIEVVRMICSQLDSICPDPSGPRDRLINFVADRPGHDYRYAIDPTKIGEQLGWYPQENFESGLRRTVDWYIQNTEWVGRVTSGAYLGERLGAPDENFKK